ncbi:MAG: DUF1275 domain-containing protein [Nevskia sp.]|nr:DUF1275 domain-containing protein [Nevskia sp.]
MSTASESLRGAVLLTFAGGYLDAFTYTGHGHVFANSMTGNVVLLGISLTRGEWPEVLTRLWPILAFLAGVFTAHVIRLRSDEHHPLRAGLLALGLELGLLLLVALLPAGFPDVPIVLGIAFMGALQSTMFARLEGQVYNSTMTTGNLRKFAESFSAGIYPRREPRALRQARLFAAVCACFAAGAVCGALVTPRFGNVAVLVPIAALGAVLAMHLWQRSDSADPA